MVSRQSRTEKGVLEECQDVDRGPGCAQISSCHSKIPRLLPALPFYSTTITETLFISYLGMFLSNLETFLSKNVENLNDFLPPLSQSGYILNECCRGKK